jgi:exosortase A-associated hydrolase 2
VSANAEISLAPFFIDGTRGRLFALEVAPPPDVEPELSVLLCPPFAEEINRTRRAVQLAARRMAAHGCCVLLLDLHGTGDSEGDIGEARWPDWHEDLARGVEWLRLHRSSRVALFGVRIGAMLALELASRLDCEHVLLWQPVAKGAQFLTQFLRLRVAADMLAADAASSTDALRCELRAGRSVEIAGYTIAPELAAGLDQLDLERLARAESPPIEWIDAVSSPERPLAPASRSVIERWRAAGVRVSAQTCVAPAFWNTPEVVVPASFIEATARIAGGWAGAGVAA